MVGHVPMRRAPYTSWHFELFIWLCSSALFQGAAIAVLFLYFKYKDVQNPFFNTIGGGDLFLIGSILLISAIVKVKTDLVKYSIQLQGKPLFFYSQVTCWIFLFMFLIAYGFCKAEIINSQGLTKEKIEMILGASWFCVFLSASLGAGVIIANYYHTLKDRIIEERIGI